MDSAGCADKVAAGAGAAAGGAGAVSAVGGRATLALALLALLVFSLAFQGSRGIAEPDEGRYTGIAGQMLRTGDFLCPALNDDVPHFAKPPLTYWAVAGGAVLLGRNGWGARLANALAYSATVALVYAIARTLAPAQAWAAPLVYAMFPGPYGAANLVTTDTLLTLWETLAVLGFVRWRDDPARGRAWLLVMWVGFGLAFFTKGPPGLLPLLAMAAFVWRAEGARQAARLFSPRGLLVFAAIGLTWYGVVVARRPELARYFLVDEVFRRVATGHFRRHPEWYKPAVVYLPMLLFGSLPWTLSLVRVAVRSVPQALRSRSWWREALAGDPWGVFLGLWFWVPLAVFCLSRSRLPLYMLPLFVPMALAAGREMAPRRPWLLRPAAVVVWLAVLAGLRWAASEYPYPKDSRPLARAIAETAGGPPGTVLFVDSRASWGVGFYLGCQVKEVSSPAAGLRPEQGGARLETELARARAGTILVVPAKRAAAVAEALEPMGWRAQVVASAGPRCIVRVAPAPSAQGP